MNPTQAAVRQTIFSSPVKPRVIGVKSYSSTGGAITFDVPRYPGKLCIVMVYNGVSAPALPTGFTNLATQTISSSAVATRVAYKFLNGSEAATLTSNSTSGNSTAHVLLIDGAVSTRAPTISTVFNSSSTANPDPSAVTVTAPVSQTLIIPTFTAAVTTSLPTQIPVGFTFANSSYKESGGNNSSFCCWSSNNTVSSFNPSAFTIPTSDIVSAYTIAVRSR